MQFYRQVFPNQVTVAASLYRYTLATPMPSADAIWEGLRPSFAIRVHFAMGKGKGHPYAMRIYTQPAAQIRFWKGSFYPCQPKRLDSLSSQKENLAAQSQAKNDETDSPVLFGVRLSHEALCRTIMFGIYPEGDNCAQKICICTYMQSAHSRIAALSIAAVQQSVL